VTNNLHGALDQASNFLKAFSGRTRLALLCLLRDGEKSVGELARLSEVRDTAVSQQLALLRREGIVRARRDGQTIFYSIASDDARTLLDLVDGMFNQCGKDA
jgi:ArsR family transcriptional regulator, virulence genes transcriptional regulator